MREHLLDSLQKCLIEEG